MKKEITEYDVDKYIEKNKNLISDEDVDKYIEKNKELLPEEKSVGDYAKAFASGAAETATLGFGDEAFGALATAYKKATGDDRDIKDIYTEFRDKARSGLKEWGDKSTVANMAGRIATGVTALPATGFAGGMALAGAMGVGESNVDLTKDIGKKEVAQLAADVTIPVAIGGILGATGRALKSVFSKPTSKLTGAIGATPKEMIGRKGVADISKSVEYWDKKGLFSSKRNAVYDVVKQKIVPMKKSVANTKLDFKPYHGVPDINELQRRSVDVLNKTGEMIDIMVEKGDEVFDRSNALNHIIEKNNLRGKLIKEFSNTTKLSNLNVVKKIDSALDILTEKLGDGPSLKKIVKVKRSLQDDVGNAWFDPNRDVVDIDIKKRISTALKDFLEENISNNPANRKIYKELNNDAHNILNLQESLARKLAKQNLGDGLEALDVGYNSFPYKITQILEKMSGGEKGTILRAKVGQAFDRPTKMLGKDVVNPLTGNTLGQGLGASIKRETGLGGMRAIQGEPINIEGTFNKREPQSIIENINNVKFKTDTAFIRENLESFALKLMQVNPEAATNIIAHADSDDPTFAREIASLTVTNPEMFEHDKYGRIDGKIPDQNKPRAIADIMKKARQGKVSFTKAIEDIQRLNLYDISDQLEA